MSVAKVTVFNKQMTGMHSNVVIASVKVAIMDVEWRAMHIHCISVVRVVR